MIFLPDRFLRKALGKGFFNSRLIDSDLKVKQSEVAAILKSDLVSETTTKREINKSIHKVIDAFKKKIAESENKKETKLDLLSDQSLVQNRIENLVIFNEVDKIKEEHSGKQYRWLPSDAENPDPEHGLLYGQIFDVGEGDSEGNMPGERYGCRCGMEILE